MKISIITVCLNSEQTIEQTIQSVVNQKDDNCEYIIVDGASKDNTLAIIGKYKDVIDKVVSEPDGGIYDAMNKGIALASGEIIGIINSDDWYEPEVFTAVRKCFQDSDADIVYGNLNLIYHDGNQNILKPGDIEKLRYQMEVPHPTVFMKKELYKQYGGFSTTYDISSDYDLILKLYIKGLRFEYLDKVMANFRMEGLSNRETEKCVEETLAISKKYLQYMPSAGKKYLKDVILRKQKAFYFDKILKCCPEIIFDILNKYMGVSLDDNIAIFGAGNWGRKVRDALRCREREPQYFVDNNPEKRQKAINDTAVYAPDILTSFKGALLIVVKDSTAEIQTQICQMNCPEIYCVTWEEIVEEYVLSRMTCDVIVSKE